ncbi:type IV toxin-antitoxin system AbiEi family antitoxin domain-containing protein [Filifactor villosus]|uniref:Type IV toxin-antitoxin system AbiEi family antitoxin domain-containing protein n=1 Tax=Filifactor villosus TaxID=29374 RepID=A0ABV9QH43_9FIRM
MNQLEQIRKISEENNGVIKTSEVISRKISKTTLAKFVEKYKYERVSHGVYCSLDVWRDELYLLQLRCPKTIFSHDTALFLLDMTDQEPLQYTVTVKSGYNATHLREDGVKVFSIKKELFELGVTKAETPFGNKVFIYDPERTVCDMIRSRSQIEIQIFQDAMKQYIKRKDKNLHRLMDYAEKLRVSKLLSNYLEVLL